MKDLILSRITLVWGLLVIATLLSWQLGHGVGLDGATAAGVAILVITFIKVRYVILDFMELRHAPRWLRAVAEVWPVLACGLLIGLLLSGGA